jgi:pimeloyl-ACP methyl ester carboxylesterase
METILVMLARLVLAVFAVLGRSDGESLSPSIDVRIQLNGHGEVDLGKVVLALENAAELPLRPTPASSPLPLSGISGALTRTMLKENLGPEFTLDVAAGSLRISLPAGRMPRETLKRRLDDLSVQIERESRRSHRYGLHATASYRPNDPARPSIVLVHGINSSSGSFVHMVGPLREAGFGVLVYDFPFNRDLGESVARFTDDWEGFRRESGEKAPWIIVTHSMGALIARGYVEGDRYGGDVSDLVMIGPPNQGSAVAKAQTLLQFVEGLQSVKGNHGNALAGLSEGLGEAADDLTPGSPFLEALNARPRRKGVRYHILAGSEGFLSKSARAQVEAHYAAVSRAPGFLGGIARVMLRDLGAQLDELTDGLGDGCVSVASTKLDGVTHHETLHVNHVALIRGPLLYPDPGPVAGIPFILRSLGKPAAHDRTR